MSKPLTEANDSPSTPKVLSISAVTLATEDMKRAVRFYRSLGFELRYGGEYASFTSFSTESGYLNLCINPSDRKPSWWGRIIFYVEDVDDFHAHVTTKDYCPDSAPKDAPWGERFFHLKDPDGHELSFATPLDPDTD